MAWLTPMISNHSFVFIFFCSNVAEPAEKSIYYNRDHTTFAFVNKESFKRFSVLWVRFITPNMEVKAIKVAKKCILTILKLKIPF